MVEGLNAWKSGIHNFYSCLKLYYYSKLFKYANSRTKTILKSHKAGRSFGKIGAKAVPVHKVVRKLSKI